MIFALSSWLILGCFLGCALMFAAALLLMSRQPAAPPPAEVRAAPEGTLLLSGAAGGNSDLRRQLAQAGFHHPEAVRWFLCIKLGLAVFGLAIAALMLRLLPWLRDMGQLEQSIILFVAAALGYFIPVTIVDKRRAAWLKRIAVALPDALDFMLICVEAGQSTDVAVMRVADELAPVHPELSAGFVALTDALAAGANRQEAWMKLAQDTGNDDLRQLATIILQSSNMGTPVAQTLRVFSADLRDQRFRRIEERANILPTKMTLGTMMFTVPPLLILLLAPAIYRIITSM